jgi:hypothetical protein
MRSFGCADSFVRQGGISSRYGLRGKAERSLLLHRTSPPLPHWRPRNGRNFAKGSYPTGAHRRQSIVFGHLAFDVTRLHQTCRFFHSFKFRSFGHQEVKIGPAVGGAIHDKNLGGEACWQPTVANPGATRRFGLSLVDL